MFCGLQNFMLCNGILVNALEFHDDAEMALSHGIVQYMA